MALSFLNNSAKKKRDQILAIDLGSRTTKAVYIQRRGTDFVFSRFVVMDAPIFEKTIPVDLLADHLKNVSQALDAKVKAVALAVGTNESGVRPTEMPQLPLNDMRQVLKNNSKTYLQQDLQGHVFDCFIIPPRGDRAPEKSKPVTGIQKSRVLVASAKKQLVDDYQAAIKSAGLIADHIIPGLIGPVNAFEKAMPEVFAKGVVALVDIGFRSTTICLLHDGELVLSRVVAIGGDRLTNGLAEAMNISYAEADGIKVGMATEVQTNLEPLVMPLGRELRASIDFFEHQQDRAVTQIFVSGGSSQSDLILQILRNELQVECKTWDPTTFLKLELPAQQTGELPQMASQLTVAIGAAMTAF